MPDTIGFPASDEDKRRLVAFGMAHGLTRTAAISYLVRSGLDTEEARDSRLAEARRRTRPRVDVEALAAQYDV